MFESLLVADRGEIARRILGTAARLGLRTVAVHSESDAEQPFVREADDAVLLGPEPPQAAYRDVVKILEAAARTGAGAIHAGAGPLAEDAAFARAVTDAGLVWVGTPAAAIAAMHQRANRTLPAAASVRRVEVQFLALTDDRVVVLGDWDSSVRRRGQSLVAESPAPGVDDATRDHLVVEAIRIAMGLGCRSAGTVEFALDPRAGDGEVVGVHARPRIGAAALELVSGVDVVEEQLRVAQGREPKAALDKVSAAGHAIELAVYAEDRSAQDALLASLRVHGTDRAAAVTQAVAAVGGFTPAGPATNLPLLAELLDHPDFRSGCYDAGLVDRLRA